MKAPKLRFKADDGSEFPEWEEKRLGDVGTVAMCKRVFKEQTSENGEVPFFKIGTFGDKPDAYISYKLFNELKTKYPYPKKGTVLLSASGTVGRQVIYNGENAYYQDSNIVWLEHDDTIMDGFLKQFYSVVKWKGLEGSTIKRLYNKTILDTMFYLPSLPEQKKIASFLPTIDDIITTTEAELNAWQERKKGVMQKIFNREVRFKADDGSEFPEWEEKRLGEVAGVKVGEKPSVIFDTVTDYEYINAGVGNSGYIDSYNCVGDTVTTPSRGQGGIGFVGYQQYRFWLGPLCYSIKSDKADVLTKYLYYFLVCHSKSIVDLKQVGTIPAINRDDLLKIRLSVPSLPEQRKIADCLSSLDDVINQIQDELSAWKEFKKGLLQQMFV